MDDAKNQGLVQIALRITPDLRERIKFAANANGRSVNSELTDALERQYPSEDKVKAVLRQAAKNIMDLGFSEEDAWKEIASWYVTENEPHKNKRKD